MNYEKMLSNMEKTLEKKRALVRVLEDMKISRDFYLVCKEDDNGECIKIIPTEEQYNCNYNMYNAWDNAIATVENLLK